MAYLLLSDKFPFQDKDEAVIREKIMRASYSFTGPVWVRISNKAKSFIKCCLTLDEERRPNAEKALQHPWIATAREAAAVNFHTQEICRAAETFENLRNFQARR